MSNIIDLSTLDRKERRAAERKQAKTKGKVPRRIRTQDEFIQVCSTTVGQFLQYIDWANHRKLDIEHLKLLGDGCNYQLQCFARAYGWDISSEDKVPVKFIMDVQAVPGQGIATDIQLTGQLGPAVMEILSGINPELQEVPSLENEDGDGQS